MSFKRGLTIAALLALLLLSAALPSLDTVSGWNATSYAGWPGVGLSAALFLIAGHARRWAILATQVVGLGAVLALTYAVPWWAGAAASLAVALPALLTAHWLQPPSAGLSRFHDGEVDVYHGVTAVSGLLCGALSAAAALAAQRGDLTHVLLTGLIAFFAATTSQLVILPFWLREAGGWRDLGNSVELWSQRAMFVVVTAGIFLPHPALPVAFLLFPVLGWSAIRAKVPETHLQVLVVSLVAFGATLTGRGPLALGSIQSPSPFAPLLVYMLVASICYLLVPLALTVERLTAVTRQATGAATTVRRMLDSATGTVFLATDPAGLITHCNPGAEQALGFSSDELLGKASSTLHSETEVERQADFFGVDGPAPERYAAVTVAQIASGLRRDWEFTRKDGERRTISLNISKMTEPGGNVVGYIASGEDITERARAQRALEKAFQRERASADALRAADEVKQELVSTVSHELRTPITSINGFVEVLLDGDLGELSGSQHDAIGRIERNSARLHRLVDDLLTLSSAESGALEITRSAVDLNSVARGAHELLVTQLAGRDLEVQLLLAPGSVLVLGDRTLLERAVSNLWSNAIKFTPDGGRVELAVDEPSTDPRGALASVTVRDTGMGIPAEEHADIFTRFYRTAAAGERAVQGSGLGLSIVKTIVEQHDGTISVESAPGAGTTFTITLQRASPVGLDEGLELPGRAVRERV